MRFLVDENLPKEVAAALEKQGANVINVAASSLAGKSDGFLNALAIAEDRVIVTRDLDFPVRHEPPPTGLLLLRVPGSFGRREIGRFIDEYAATADLLISAGSSLSSPGAEIRALGPFRSPRTTHSCQDVSPPQRITSPSPVPDMG